MKILSNLLYLRQRKAPVWPPPDWAATHQHRKGGRYRVIGEALAEATLQPVVIYDDVEGHIWVRPKAEFLDGRFTPV